MANTSTIVNAFQKFYASDGVTALGGGTATFYLNKTTTLASIFSDPALSVSQTNPYTLDAGGRIQGDVRFSGTLSILLKDSAGATIRTDDDNVCFTGTTAFGGWDAGVIYGVGDLVEGSDGLYYVSIAASNLNNDPASGASPTKWSQIVFRGIYNASETYALGDVIQDATGNNWKSLSAANTGNTPSTSPTKWQKDWLYSLTIGITAGTTQTQAGATALTADVNEVSVCANTGDVVELKAAGAGFEQTVINNGVESMQVFPASGDSINGGAVDAVDPVVIQTLNTRTYIAHDDTSWNTKSESIPLSVEAVPSGSVIDYAGLTVPADYLACDGAAVSRTTYSGLFTAVTASKGTFTITIAAPAVITNVGHGLVTGDLISATTTGDLPTGMTASTNYFFIRVNDDTGNIATTYANAFAGTKITTSGSQSGTHTLLHNPWGISGASNFLLPDFNRKTSIGMGGSATATIGNALGNTGGAETHSLTSAQNGAHTHSVPGAGTSTGGANPTSTGLYNNTSSDPVAVTASSGSGAAHNNMQPSNVVKKIIKI